MFVIKNNPDFSFSLSKYNLFNTCAKKYFFHYYGSHNGWLVEAPALNKTIYKYKYITNLDTSFGSFVHKEIKKFIINYARNNFIKFPTFISDIKKELNESYQKGKNINEWSLRPKYNPLMMEYYYWGGYNSDESKQVIKNIQEKISRLSNFYNSLTIKELTVDIKRIIEIDEDFNSGDCGYFMFNNKKIFSKIDFLYVRNSDGKYIIVDWKTSNFKNNNPDFLQLKFYAYYVHNKYNIPYEKIEARYENLYSGNCLKITDFENNDKIIETIITNSIKELSEYVKNKDLTINEALPIENFLPINNDKICHFCPYQQICHNK